MLENQRKRIEELQESDVTFQEYYQAYVLDVQDKNILEEMKYLVQHNSVNPLMVDRAINSCIEEMKKL